MSTTDQSSTALSPAAAQVTTTVTASAEGTGVLALIRKRLGEPSTWAGIGGVILAALTLLPIYLPQLQAAWQQHGAAKVSAIVLALAAFILAIVKAERIKTVVSSGVGSETIIRSGPDGQQITIANAPPSGARSSL